MLVEINHDDLKIAVAHWLRSQGLQAVTARDIVLSNHDQLVVNAQVRYVPEPQDDRPQDPDTRNMPRYRLMLGARRIAESMGTSGRVRSPWEEDPGEEDPGDAGQTSGS